MGKKNPAKVTANFQWFNICVSLKNSAFVAYAHNNIFFLTSIHFHFRRYEKK